MYIRNSFQQRIGIGSPHDLLSFLSFFSFPSFSYLWGRRLPPAIVPQDKCLPTQRHSLSASGSAGRFDSTEPVTLQLVYKVPVQSAGAYAGCTKCRSFTQVPRVCTSCKESVKVLQSSCRLASGGYRDRDCDLKSSHPPPLMYIYLLHKPSRFSPAFPGRVVGTYSVILGRSFVI